MTNIAKTEIAMASIIRILFASFLLAASLQAAAWKTEVVDPGGGGKFSSLRIDHYGNVHVAYYDDRDGLLKYAFWDHGIHKWFTTTLDKSGGFCSMVLDSKDHPHISYDEYGTGKLKYAYWDGSTWHKQTIQLKAKGIHFYTSIALNAQDRPSISFYEEINADGEYGIRLQEVTWDGGAWELRTADAEKGSGKFNSILIDSAGHIHIAYANVRYEGTSVRYASWNGQSWDLAVVEGAGNTGYGAWSVFAMMDQRDIPHITYTDLRERVVKYASKNGAGKWTIQVVDGISKWAYPDRNGLALDQHGNPYVSYYDAGLGVLKVAHERDGRWVAEVVDQNFAGYTSSLQIYNDTIWVSYADESSGGLKVAHRPIDGAGSMAQEPETSRYSRTPKAGGPNSN